MADKQKRANREGSIAKVKGRSGYRAQVTLLDGSRPTKQCRSLQEARDWIQKQLFLEEAGELPPARRLTFGEWSRSWLESRAERVTPKTLANETSHYRNYFGPLAKLQLDRMTAGDIQGWLANIERRGLKRKPGVGQPHTARICHSLLSAILRDAVQHHLIRSSPMSGVAKPKLPSPAPKFLDRDDALRLLDAVDATGDPRSTAVHLMLRLGLRRNEALGLTWSDVDFDSGMVTIRFQLGRVDNPDPPEPGSRLLVRRELKTMSSRRTLRISGELLDRLVSLRHSALEEDPNAFVVTLDGYTPTDPDAMSHWLKQVGRDIGVAVTPHRLRHTSATMMLNRGVAIEVVGKVLGHSDHRTTGVYARVLDSTGAAALDVLAGDLDEPRQASPH